MKTKSLNDAKSDMKASKPPNPPTPPDNDLHPNGKFFFFYLDLATQSLIRLELPFKHFNLTNYCPLMIEGTPAKSTVGVLVSSN